MAGCFGLGKYLKTLQHFELYRDVPEAVAYIVYATIKLIICVAYLVVLFQTYCSCSRDRCPIKYCYCRPYKYAFCFLTILLDLLYVIVGTLFGAPLGIVERSYDEYIRTRGYVQSSREDQNTGTRQVAQCCITVCINRDIEKDNEGNDLNNLCGRQKLDKLPTESNHDGGKRLYIRGNKLGANEVLILAAVLVPFIVTIITTFWDRYTLKQTINCSEDREVYCFPLAIAPTTNRDLNISIDTPRINDCSIWMTSDISPNVTFRCFQCVNDFEGAIAALGGLTTIFKLTIKLGFSLLIIITHFFLKCLKCVCARCEESTRKSWVKLIRTFLAIIVAIIEVTFAFVLGNTYAKHQLTYDSFTDHTSNRYKIFNHFNIPLVVCGIATTSLLIPLEEYVNVYRGEYCDATELQRIKSYDKSSYKELESNV